MSDFLKIFVVLILVIILGFGFQAVNKKEKNIPVDTIETRYEKLHNYISTFNSAQNELSTVKNYTDLTNIIQNKFPTEATVNFTDHDIIKVTFSHGEKLEYNLLDYDIYPMMLLLDGSMFIIINYENGCKKVDKNTPMNSDCVFLVDVNGVNPPNMRNGEIEQTDRYEMIFDGKKKKVYYKDRYMNDLKQAFSKQKSTERNNFAIFRK